MTGSSEITSRLLFATILFVSIAASASGQELKDRELRPAFDFTRVQMPVEIVSIKLTGKNVAPGEKIKGDDDWIKGVSFTLKNISDKLIAYVAIAFYFEPPNGPIRTVGFILSHGVDYSRGEPRNGSSPLPIQPGQTIDLVLTDERYPKFLHILSLGGMPRSVDVVPYYVDRTSFEDDPNMIWEGGYLKRRNPAALSRFDIVERYKLPTKR